MERHRFLSLLLRELDELVKTSVWVLDVAPQLQIQKEIEKTFGQRYVTIDRGCDLDIDVQADLTLLPFPNGTFDLVICYHVLEHVIEDQKAMREMARVMNPAGLAVIQVPRRRGSSTVEDPGAPPEERAERFGQPDHVRYYGRDLEERLAAAGLEATTIRPDHVIPRGSWPEFGISDEEVWLCRVTGPGAEPGTLELGELESILLELRAPRPPAPPPRPKRRRTTLRRTISWLKGRIG